MSNRIDKELVLRNFVNSRTKAQELINCGFVCCNEKVINKTSYSINSNDELTILDNDKQKYVSRGGLKLEKAINTFEVDFNNKIVMDIESSTGGFTDCALQHGAAKVIAVDVGSNQMNENLKKDERIDLHENTNIKDLSSELFKLVDIIIIDVSFVSLTHIIEKIHKEKISVEIISLIKPQFECEYEIASKYKGVIINKKIHKEILNNIIIKFDELGFKIISLTYSPIKGGDGNVEYIAYFSNLNKKIVKNINIDDIVEKGFNI